MKIITESIFEALQSFYKATGSQKAMATTLGLSRGQVSRLLNHHVRYFEDTTWNRIKDILAPHIVMGKNCTSCTDCPLAGKCNFQNLVEQILSVPREKQAAWFFDLDQYIEKTRKRYL